MYMCMHRYMSPQNLSSTDAGIEVILKSSRHSSERTSLFPSSRLEVSVPKLSFSRFALAVITSQEGKD